jgi:hypothetical protein
MPSSTSHKPPRSRDLEDSGAGGGGDVGEGDGGGGDGGGGRLVKVAFARTEAEGELLQGLLREAGIASMLQRSAPIPGAAYMPGPSNVMVTAEAAPRAREVLRDTFGESEADELAELEQERRLARGETGMVDPGRLALWVGGGAAVAVALIWVLYELT